MSVEFECDDVLAARIRVVAAQLDQTDLARELLEVARILDPAEVKPDAPFRPTLFEAGSDRR